MPKVNAAKQAIRDATRAVVTDLIEATDIDNGDIIGDELNSCYDPINH